MPFPYCMSCYLVFRVLEHVGQRNLVGIVLQFILGDATECVRHVNFGRLTDGNVVVVGDLEVSEQFCTKTDVPTEFGRFQVVVSVVEFLAADVKGELRTCRHKHAGD